MTEVPDGYHLYLDPRSLAARHLLESMCCPFLELHIRPRSADSRPVLEVRGDAEIKAFVAAEFGIRRVEGSGRPGRDDVRRSSKRPGTYALVLSSSRTTRIRVGALGRMTVRPGFYVYVGSAFGPGGVAARVGRHRLRPARRWWHVDYLRSVTRLVDVWITHDPERREHDWAAAMGEGLGGVVPLAGFGASDCRCRSHLHYFRTRPCGKAFARYLARGHAARAPRRGRTIRWSSIRSWPAA